MSTPHPATWLHPRPQGLFCAPGGFFIDPVAVVDRAVITHAHSDHARPGHRHVLAHPDTLALMRQRLGAARAGKTQQPLDWGETVTHGGVRIGLAPAGHIRGSSQVVLDYAGSRVVISGDYKRQPDPTCAPFVPVPCDVFVTEATFALPVFTFPAPETEIARLLASLALFPGRTHLIGCYPLGKCQRLVALLRAAGWDRPVFVNGTHAALCAAYQALGVDLGVLRPAAGATRADLAGAIVLASPGAADPWVQRMTDPVVAFASGWLALRRRSRMRGIELPLVISDHADWTGLLTTIEATGAPDIWVTHGRADALTHALAARGRRARELRLVGYADATAEDAPG